MSERKVRCGDCRFWEHCETVTYVGNAGHLAPKRVGYCNAPFPLAVRRFDEFTDYRVADSMDWDCKAFQPVGADKRLPQEVERAFQLANELMWGIVQSEGVLVHRGEEWTWACPDDMGAQSFQDAAAWLIQNRQARIEHVGGRDVLVSLVGEVP